MKVKSESEVAQSCPTLCDPMDCSLPGSFFHGISQARVLEWVAIAFSVGADYMMWNAEPDESQARIMIAGKNINSFRYADDITLMTESEEKLKNLLMRVNEESGRAGLKLIRKTKIMAEKTQLWMWLVMEVKSYL